MKGQDQKNIKQGSITVFLSLILLLILSLLFTIIEGARISTAKVYAERALTTAMDSVLAGYYGPLWREYHLFGLDIDQGSNGSWEEEASLLLQEYMSYTFIPDKNLGAAYMDSRELYDISVESLSVSGRTMLTDYKGELFVNQAVEYMKYKELGNVLELLMEKMSLLESPKKVSFLYEEKQKVEEELVEIDEGILKLMELLDGVETGKKGIETEKDGSLKTASYFVKQFVFAPVNQEQAEINQESIFLALKDSYINPMTDFALIENNFSEINKILLRQKEAQKKYMDTVTSLNEAKELLNSLNSIDNKSSEVKVQIKEVKAQIKDLKASKEELLKEVEALRDAKQTYIDSITTINNKNYLRFYEIKNKINSAIEAINSILEKVKIAEPLITGYEKSLESTKDEMDEAIYTGMEEDLKELKRYSELNGKGYDFNGMKQTLNENLAILTTVEGLMRQGDRDLALEDYQSSRVSYTKAATTLATYKTDNLKLDYSTIVLNKNGEFDPLKKAGSFLQDGMVSLIIDPEIISKAELTTEELPSVIAAMAGDENGFLDQLTTFFEHSIIGNNNSGMGNMFGSFGEDAGSLVTLGEGINKVAELFLFQEYIGEHFYSFPKEGEDIATRKPSVLSYEQEYLLTGKSTDQENLTSVISRILFLRTILDFVSILGDKDKCNEAKLAAAALVGFTGLPVLVSITKTLILLVWSFAEALVDTSALLMGKEVSILKKNLILTFPELFLLSPSFIQKKAAEMKKIKELSLTYHEYLYLFLIMKNKKEKTYRAMDLIQENLQLRYQDDFLIKNCLFGFETETKFLISSRFTGTSFVQKQIGQSPKGYQFGIKAAYSY